MFYKDHRFKDLIDFEIGSINFGDQKSRGDIWQSNFCLSHLFILTSIGISGCQRRKSSVSLFCGVSDAITDAEEHDLAHEEADCFEVPDLDRDCRALGHVEVLASGSNAGDFGIHPTKR